MPNVPVAKRWHMGAAAIACTVLGAIGALLMRSEETAGTVGALLLIVAAPTPIFALSIILPYQTPKLRDLGGISPALAGVLFHMAIGILVGLAQFARGVVPMFGPFMLYAWPSYIVHEIGCGLEFWPCLRPN